VLPPSKIFQERFNPAFNPLELEAAEKEVDGFSLLFHP